MLIWKCICWNVSFWDPHPEDRPKTAISFEIPWSCDWFVSKKAQIYFFHLCLNTKPSTCTIVTGNKIFAFFPGVGILVNRCSKKCATRFRKSCFSNNLVPLEFLLSFVYEAVEWKLSICGKQFPWTTADFAPCIRNSTVQTFFKIVINFDTRQFSHSYFSVTTGLISFIKISFENFTLVEQRSVEIFLIFALGSWLPRSSKKWNWKPPNPFTALNSRMSENSQNFWI